MTTLKHKHLLTLELKVDFAAMQNIGQTPFGLRRIVPVSEGIFSGEQLKGLVLPGADWVLNRHDGVMQIDVRLVLKTDDDDLFILPIKDVFWLAKRPCSVSPKVKSSILPNTLWRYQLVLNVQMVNTNGLIMLLPSVLVSRQGWARFTSFLRLVSRHFKL